MTETAKKLLPTAIALWPKLNEAEVYRPIDKRGQPSDAQKRRYVVNLKFDKRDQLQVDAWLKACLADFGLDQGKLPWKRDKTTGELTLWAASGDDSRPKALDADQNEVPLSVTVGSGSKLKVYVTAIPYTSFGGGISIHINSYQILDLKEEVESPFQREKGYTFNASPRTSRTYNDNRAQIALAQPKNAAERTRALRTTGSASVGKAYAHRRRESLGRNFVSHL